MKIQCILTGHENEIIWEGPVLYDGKKNKEPLYFEGGWIVRRCKRCNEEFYEKRTSVNPRAAESV